MNKWLLIGCIVVAGCSNQSGAKFEFYSGKAPVIAVLHDDLFVGEVAGTLIGRGTINMQSQQRAELNCSGQFEYSTIQYGSGEMQCSDGRMVMFQFDTLSLISGYGIGTAMPGPLSFTYGLTLAEAGKYLTLPKGKAIRKTDKGLQWGSV